MSIQSSQTGSPLPQLARLRDIVAKLRAPDGCPWDREQTHASLRSGAIEEVYEMVEAIDSGDDPHFKEELGDLLLQVVMHAQIAGEEGRFDLEAIAAEVADKLVRRHPHVFGENRLGDSEAVLKQWDEIKRTERETQGAPANASALDGVSMAVDVDAESLTPQQREILRNFTRSGGALLTGPPNWKDSTPAGERITLDQAELDRLNDIWRDVNSMIGRRNMGVRLFNVASMLSNFLAAPGGKTAIVHLVNYSDYPVENVAMHFLGDYKRATLITPGASDRELEVYKTEEGRGVDVDRVGVCATVKLEQ